MASAIGQMQELIGLTLATSGERANDEGAFLISRSLDSLATLQALTLGFYEYEIVNKFYLSSLSRRNSMTDKAAEYISDSLRKLTNVSSL